jgi:hypothetical protein
VSKNRPAVEKFLEEVGFTMDRPDIYLFKKPEEGLEDNDYSGNMNAIKVVLQAF